MSDTSLTDTVPAIEAIDVCKSFDRGRVRGLDRFTATVNSGEYVAVTGPSGCGKSTLLHLLAALDRPDSGSLHVHGLDLAALEDANRYRRELVGIVFQLHNLLPHLTALENVEVAMFSTHRNRNEERARAHELLESVDLAGREGRKPPQLSGGERQRVAIARALANRPPLLLADEPTAQLDSDSGHRIMQLLHTIVRVEGTTIVVATHDPLMLDAADRVVELRDGVLVEAGAPA